MARRITSKGQVTIPLEIRKRHDFVAGSSVDFREVDGRVVVGKARADRPKRPGQAALDALLRRASTGARPTGAPTTTSMPCAAVTGILVDTSLLPDVLTNDLAWGRSQPRPLPASSTAFASTRYERAWRPAVRRGALYCRQSMPLPSIWRRAAFQSAMPNSGEARCALARAAYCWMTSSAIGAGSSSRLRAMISISQARSSM